MASLLRIHALAANTFREAIRNKLLYTLLGFSFLMIASGVLLATLSYVEVDEILQDMGMSAIRFFSAGNQHDDRTSIVCANTLAHRQAINPGKVDIKHDCIGGLRRDPVDRSRTVGLNRHLHPMRAEKVSHHRGQRHVVLDQENTVTSCSLIHVGVAVRITKPKRIHDTDVTLNERDCSREPYNPLQIGAPFAKISQLLARTTGSTTSAAGCASS